MSDSLNLRFAPGDESLSPDPRGHVRTRRGRVVVTVSRAKYDGDLHAAVQFGDRTEWVRRRFDGLILPSSSATLCPFDVLPSLVRYLVKSDIEVVVERDAWEAACAA